MSDRDSFEALGQRWQLSAYLVVTGLVDCEASADPSRIIYATRSGTSIRLKDRLWRALQAGDAAQVGARHLARLRELEVIVPAGQDEFAELSRRNRAGLAASTRLAVTIQPTANCQLGCGYCGQVHQKRNVDDAVAMQITDRIVANLGRNGYRDLSVMWYGGEPLMAYTKIVDMSQRLRAYCAENAIAYEARMITNGLSLKPAVFLGLLEQDVRRFQVTLDGLGKTHDLMRITKEGHKTFDIIFRNILEVTALPEYAESQASIMVRINVNRQSAKTIPQLIDRLAEHNLGAKRVTLDFAPIVDWGGNGASRNSMTKEEFAAAEIGWMIQGIKSGFVFRHVLPRPRHGACMVVQRDAEVYDASGNVYPCYEYPYTPQYETPQYRIGHLDTIGAQRNLDATPKNWLIDLEGDIAPCRHCNLFPVCGGACPKQWHNGQSACPSYKLNMEDRLILDYLAVKQGGLRKQLLA